MESKGKVISIARDMDGGVLLTTSLSGVNWHELESLDKNTDYRIKIVKWAGKRSFSQNNYMWELTDQIAMKVGSTRDEIHAEHMQKYGLLAEGSNTIPAYQEPEEAFPPMPDGNRYYFKFLGQSEDMKWKSYKRIRGTHEYNTKEFSYFLDRVIEDAKELGIETLTPAELERMMKK